MSQNSEQAFPFLRRVVSGAQGGAEEPFVATDDALDLPALSVDAFEETPFHLPPVLGLGPAAARVAAIQGNDRAANPQLLAAQPVVAFAVIARVAQQAGQPEVADGLPHGRGELRMVVARATHDIRPGNQMALGVTDQCELGPATTPKATLSAAFDEVGACLVTLQAGGVNGPLGLGGDQAEVTGALKNGRQQAVESPFFNRRSSA